MEATWKTIDGILRPDQLIAFLTEQKVIYKTKTQVTYLVDL